MFCSNCGQRLTDDAKHCPNCGVLIRRDTEEPKEAPKSEDSRYEYDQAAYNYSYGTPETPQPQPAPAPAPAPYGAPVTPTKADSSALTGLILAIVSGVCCCLPFVGLPCAVLGIIFSAKGLKSTNRKAMAVIGLILAIIFTVCNLVTAYSFFNVLANPDAWQDILNDAGFDYDFEFRFR